MTSGWYSRLEFRLGVSSFKQLPDDDGTEVAFAGRSNVGKSSTINKITNRRGLARISKSPGRTRELNFFSYDAQTHLVDLPGYGYAKVNEDMRAAWRRLIERYLSERQSLRGVFLIMDVRHPMSQFDQMMLEFCHACHLPLHILLNKADKLSKNNANKVMHSVRQDLTIADSSIQLFSALKGTGLEQAREKLANWLYAN